jgi:hypothetical protein
MLGGVQKDNSCKTSGESAPKSDKVPFKSTQPFTTGLKLKSVTPTALWTIRAYVVCEEQKENEFCHVVNFHPTAPEGLTALTAGAAYFQTKVMDNRPKNLWVAVLICAFIGPVLLAAFMVYERGILAKQA